MDVDGEGVRPGVVDEEGGLEDNVNGDTEGVRVIDPHARPAEGTALFRAKHLNTFKCTYTPPQWPGRANTSLGVVAFSLGSASIATDSTLRRRRTL